MRRGRSASQPCPRRPASTRMTRHATPRHAVSVSSAPRQWVFGRPSTSRLVGQLGLHQNARSAMDNGAACRGQWVEPDDVILGAGLSIEDSRRPEERPDSQTASDGGDADTNATWSPVGTECVLPSGRPGHELTCEDMSHAYRRMWPHTQQGAGAREMGIRVGSGTDHLVEMHHAPCMSTVCFGLALDWTARRVGPCSTVLLTELWAGLPALGRGHGALVLLVQCSAV